MGRQYSSNIHRELLNYHPAGVTAIQGVLQPVIDPLFRLRRKIGRVEEDQIECASYPGKEVASHHVYTRTSGAECRVRVDVCCHDIGYQCKLTGDESGTSTDFQNPITRLHLIFCGIEQEVCIGFGLVNLRQIMGHVMTLVLGYVLRL